MKNIFRFIKNIFNVVSLEDFFSGNFDAEKFNVCITFDDGFYNNYKYVLPLMETYKMPMSFFITGIRDAGYDILWNDYLGIITKYGPGKIQFLGEIFFKEKGEYITKHTRKTLKDILQSGDFLNKKLLMEMFNNIVSFRANKEDENFWQQISVDDIKELACSEYSTVGAHGYYHNDLSEISAEQASEEMINVKLFLENICQKEIDAIAFPYGSYSPQVIYEAKKAGYKKLLALNFKREEDLSNSLLKERMIINPYISIVNQMYAIIKGKYE